TSTVRGLDGEVVELEPGVHARSGESCIDGHLVCVGRNRHRDLMARVRTGGAERPFAQRVVAGPDAEGPVIVLQRGGRAEPASERVGLAGPDGNRLGVRAPVTAFSPDPAVVLPRVCVADAAVRAMPGQALE